MGEMRLIQVNDQLGSTMFATFDETGDPAWRKLVAMLGGNPAESDQTPVDSGARQGAERNDNEKTGIKRQ